jgi:damage-control phosphatase, subfamily III
VQHSARRLIYIRYRLLRSLFTASTSPYWQTYDPFFNQKMDTFKNSGDAVFRTYLVSTTRSHRVTETYVSELATTLQEVGEEKSALESDPEKLGVLFKEMVQMCLW